MLSEAAAAAMGISLDRLGVSLFALDGADKFKHVLKVVGEKGFKLPICGLCDEDRRDSWATALGLKPKNLGQHGFFIASSDLEHEYVRAIGVPIVVQALIANGVARRGFMTVDGTAGTSLLRQHWFKTNMCLSRLVPAP